MQDVCLISSLVKTIILHPSIHWMQSSSAPPLFSLRFPLSKPTTEAPHGAPTSHQVYQKPHSTNFTISFLFVVVAFFAGRQTRPGQSDQCKTKGCCALCSLRKKKWTRIKWLHHIRGVKFDQLANQIPYCVVQLEAEWEKQHIHITHAHT